MLNKIIQSHLGVPEERALDTDEDVLDLCNHEDVLASGNVLPGHGDVALDEVDELLRDCHQIDPGSLRENEFVVAEDLKHFVIECHYFRNNFYLLRVVRSVILSNHLLLLLKLRSKHLSTSFNFDQAGIHSILHAFLKPTIGAIISSLLFELTILFSGATLL